MKDGFGRIIRNGVSSSVLDDPWLFSTPKTNQPTFINGPVFQSVSLLKKEGGDVIMNCFGFELSQRILSFELAGDG